MRVNRLYLICLIALCWSAGQAALASPLTGVQGEPPESYTTHARLILIDKRTAKKETITLATGHTVAHETLEVRLERCWIEGTRITPEHAALVEIYEPRIIGGPNRMFSGWLFHRKSELSNVEHAKYDVKLMACVNKNKTTASDTP